MDDGPGYSLRASLARIESELRELRALILQPASDVDTFRDLVDAVHAGLHGQVFSAKSVTAHAAANDPALGAILLEVGTVSDLGRFLSRHSGKAMHNLQLVRVESGTRDGNLYLVRPV